MKDTLLVKTVKQILQEEQKPLSVPEIQKILSKKDITPNKTSLYRLLKKLKEVNIIEEVLLDTKTVYYEIKTHHHHHFTCTECEAVKCIEDKNLEKQVHQVGDTLEKQGFSITHHHFSFSGKCLQCNI